MESTYSERRNAPRYSIPARVVLRRGAGTPIPATAINISSSGMLIRLDQPVSLNAGEAVTVDIDLPSACEKALFTWGVGMVVRLDGDAAAIQLQAGSFGQQEPAAQDVVG